jgi:hypothetical protein
MRSMALFCLADLARRCTVGISVAESLAQKGGVL